MNTNSKPDLETVFLAQLTRYELAFCTSKTKTDRLIAACKANALRDLADVVGLDQNTWLHYQRVAEAGR